MRLALLGLLALAPSGLHAQGAAANEHGGQICWALATSAQPTAEIMQRITEERCQRGDALMVIGLRQEALPIAAGFCDLNHPITLEQADGTRSLLCTYAGQRRMGRNGQERPRPR
ncbi:hypothetical protein KTR66_01890 [Roseococcus sp. SDR]|uniref:hypothetical protein n=1 Tax=Roseococcus sp. SDR TaxID=2835532 RepID=UPI001BCD4A2B|nr:hypothetical protein [Roseococcus sp. SDR]MBS7788725.1 hypothetical protein [Roseococcus sp. SDR]MBV1844039.1 hypothetical protein [Roseococcus sp. SDR]